MPLALPLTPSALRSPPAAGASRGRTACRASSSRLTEAWEQARSGAASAAAAVLLLAASPLSAHAAKLAPPLVPVPIVSEETAQEVVLGELSPAPPTPPESHVSSLSPPSPPSVEEEIAALVLVVGLPLGASAREAGIGLPTRALTCRPPAPLAVGVLRIASGMKASSADEPSSFSVSGARRVEQVRDISPRRRQDSLLSSLFASNVSDMSAPVSTVMTREVLRTFPTSTVASALAQMDACTGLVVVSESDGGVLGIFSKHDAVRAAPADTVSAHMSSPALTIVASTQIVEAAALMLKHEVHRLPVTDTQGAMVGILTRTDVFQSILSKYGNKQPEAAVEPMVVRLR